MHWQSQGRNFGGCISSKHIQAQENDIYFDEARLWVPLQYVSPLLYDKRLFMYLGVLARFLARQQESNLL